MRPWVPACSAALRDMGALTPADSAFSDSVLQRLRLTTTWGGLMAACFTVSKLFAGLFVSLAVLLPAAQAQESAGMPASSPAPAGAEGPAAMPGLSATAKAALPKLVIKWQCEEPCTANEKVPPLIEAAYAKAAAAHGYAISESESADATIVDYRQRPPAVRVMLGILAGKDRLGLRIAYRGKDYTVNDYSANALQGMNSLCESAGTQSYTKMAEAIGEGSTGR
jgi:hypothetical protein